ncbi:protein disulfide isomerase pTAC5, chloroplastic [Mercurialis annua]|uniref:protein disulfide isomerase pTAC5, chloroplastic n=1 Tax=Mercurialis annua TaxID=3986 RepID=UPI00215E3FE4|nr:protein disulfide isomerase pTAC5, chloroplastic [Mercurialis annua]
MLSSLFPLRLNPPPRLSIRKSKQHSLSPNLHSSLSLSNSHLCRFSSSLPNTPPNADDEFLWRREEQRWIREEQRWLREEQRWLREREALINEIESLKLQNQALEQRISVQDVELVPETVSKNVLALLQVLNEKNMIADSVSSPNQSPSPSANPNPTPTPTPSSTVLEDEVEDVKEVINVSERKKNRTTLRIGSEGDDVRELQEALLKLGFYSGEEDMEFSSFAGGTERAVKTWQASIGASEDGIMTIQLLKRLFMEQETEDTGTNFGIAKMEGANGAAVASVTNLSEIPQKIVRKEGLTESKASEHRVFLLGENRWEDPSRLIGKDKKLGASKQKDFVTRCLSCNGAGRLMCTECDGSGEPNVEPQFLEWVGEETKCPYCEGLGYTICDLCEGKTVV